MPLPFCSLLLYISISYLGESAAIRQAGHKSDDQLLDVLQATLTGLTSEFQQVENNIHHTAKYGGIEGRAVDQGAVLLGLAVQIWGHDASMQIGMFLNSMKPRFRLLLVRFGACILITQTCILHVQCLLYARTRLSQNVGGFTTL